MRGHAQRKKNPIIVGRIESITYPDGETVSYGYDYGGQVKSVTGTHYGVTTDYVEDIGYDEYGQRVYIKYGNGIETSYTYDENRRWLDTINTRTGWNEVYQAMSYSFDEVGNVLGVTNTASTYQTSYSYSYDALYQLTHAEGQISAQKYGMADYTSRYTQDFGFDTIGNLTSKISTLTTIPSKTIGASLDYKLDYAYYPGKAHQAERVGDLWYRYDANGNMTEERQGGHSMTPSDEADLSLVGDVRVANRGFGLSTGEPSGSHVYERTFTWDEENRLKRSTDAAITVDYRYGSDGERTVKYSSSGETLYFDSLWQMTSDYPNLRQSKHVYVGEARIATRCNIKGYTDAGYETLNTYYYHPDHLGSAQLVTDYEGQKYEHMEYTPYGELWVEEVSEPVSKTPFRFTGKEMDEETGLYYYGARYMNPRTSLWISVDPAMDGMNWYGYCAWNPVKYTDPTGLAAVACTPDIGCGMVESVYMDKNSGKPVTEAVRKVDAIPLSEEKPSDEEAADLLLKTAKNAIYNIEEFQPGYPNYKGWHDFGYEKKPGAQPGMTHCNEAAPYILEQLGNDLSAVYNIGTANRKGGSWNTGATDLAINAAKAALNPSSGVKEVTAEEAQRLANKGIGVLGLAINLSSGFPSHAGVVVPDKNQFDPARGPLIAQAGEINGIRYADNSFQGLGQVHYYIFPNKR